MLGFMQKYGYPLCALISAVLAFFLMVAGLSLVIDLSEVVVVGRLMDAMSGLTWLALKVTGHLIVYATYLYFLVPFIGGIRTVAEEYERFGMLYLTIFTSLIAVMFHMGATELLAVSLGTPASSKDYLISVVGFAGLSLIAGLLVGKSIQCAVKAGWFR